MSQAAPAALKTKKLPATPRRLCDLVAGRRGHVIRCQHGADLDVFHRRQFGGHVEVHHVAGIVAVHEQHAGAAIDSLGAFVDRIWRGRCEDVSDGCCIGKALADEPEECRLVPGTAADDEPDFSGARPILGNDRARASCNARQMTRVRCKDAGKHLVDRLAAFVDDLLGLHPFWHSLEPGCGR